THEISINLTKRLAFRPVVAVVLYFSAREWVSNYGIHQKPQLCYTIYAIPAKPLNEAQQAGAFL
ncbi:MAG: hypothetical protein FWH40_08560, partial [Coriobacteriia bacterium]|nr:hypothetical protein [Coriobacteriia bacterium]